MGCSTNLFFFWFLDSFFGNGLMKWILLVQTRNVGLVTNIPTAEYLSGLQVLGNLEITEVLKDYVRSFKPSKGTNLFILIILAGDIEMNPSFIQDLAYKHIPSKTSRLVSSIPWITPEIRRKIRRKNKTHAKAKKAGSSKLRSKFETLRREIKADVRKQHDFYVNNLVGDVKANPRDFYRYINSQKKDTQGIPPLKRKNGKGVAQSDLEKAEEFNGQFTDVFNKMKTPRSRFWIGLHLS